MLLKGDGLPQDAAEAVKWYRKAADQGYAKAQYNLGVCYTQGTGGPQDSAEAVKWYRNAAEQNFPMHSTTSESAMRKATACPRTLPKR